MAGGEHDRGIVRSRGTDSKTEAAPPQPALERTVCGMHGGQRRVVHRLQGLVHDGRRQLLRAADAYRCPQPVSAALPGDGRTDTAHVWPVLEAAFREFGLPHRLRSDNGPPFASRGAGGLSQLSVKVIKAGVLPERIAPGKPQQNGRHERMHLTLLQDTAKPAARSLREQLERCACSRTSTTKNARMRRSATIRRPSITLYRRAALTVSCANRATGPTRSSGACVKTERSSGTATRSISAKRWSASPVGLAENDDRLHRQLWPDRARHNRPSRRSIAKTKTQKAVDLWTTLRVAHRVHSLNNNRPERNENCVTHVVGLNCYLCSRLLSFAKRRRVRGSLRGSSPRFGYRPLIRRLTS